MLELKSLELSDTEVGSNGLRHLSGQPFSLPLSFPFCILCVFLVLCSLQVIYLFVD